MVTDRKGRRQKINKWVADHNKLDDIWDEMASKWAIKAEKMQRIRHRTARLAVRTLAASKNKVIRTKKAGAMNAPTFKNNNPIITTYRGNVHG